MSLRSARLWHGLTFAVAVFALVTQLVLSVSGASVLVDEDPPSAPLRVGRFISYFTIQSNLLVAVATGLLTIHPDRDGRAFRWLHLSAIGSIIVTGLVHFFLLRPLLDLEGWPLLCDKLLHMVVPILAVIGWVLFGPRPRIDLATIRLTYIWPLAWLAWTLVVDGITRWVPYPFLNFRDEGWGVVIVSCVGILALFTALLALLSWLDRRLPATPVAADESVGARS